MGANGIFQLKQPLLPCHSRFAQKDLSFNTNELNRAYADNLINIYPEQLMLSVFHTQPQGPDIAIGAAYGNYIYWLIAHIPTTSVYLFQL